MDRDKFLRLYYAQRAKEYEKVYLKPERQQNLRELKELLKTVFSGHHVLEVACGTGYWTQTISETAASVLATDCNEEVIEIAKTKGYHACQVSFAIADAYALTPIEGYFTACFCGFWFSHIPKTRRDVFIRGLHAKLPENALVVMIDNRYVEGSSTSLSGTDGEGNSYQIRHLEDGTAHKILKNFPTETELKKAFKRYSRNFEVLTLDYFWIAKYTVY